MSGRQFAGVAYDRSERKATLAIADSKTVLITEDLRAWDIRRFVTELAGMLDALSVVRLDSVSVMLPEDPRERPPFWLGVTLAALADAYGCQFFATSESECRRVLSACAPWWLVEFDRHRIAARGVARAASGAFDLCQSFGQPIKRVGPDSIPILASLNQGVDGLWSWLEVMGNVDDYDEFGVKRDPLTVVTAAEKALPN